MSWYYSEANKPVGPVADDEFEKLVAAGRILPLTLVWREGMAVWQPFGTVAGVPAAGAAVAGDEVCCECGKPFHTDDMIHYGGTWVCAACKPVFFQRLSESGTAALALEYGGFWLRALAKLVDTLILSITGVIMGMVAGLMMGSPKAQDISWDFILSQVVLAVLGMIVSVAYTIWFVGKFGATPGKMACGLRIVRPDGRPLTYARACGRFFAEWLSGMTLYVGYIMAGLDREKRALHDHVCDTRVVRSRD